MAALAGGTVQRTLSGVRGESTGLSDVKTHEAGGEDFGNLTQAFVRR
jgi:hypothetical protein